MKKLIFSVLLAFVFAPSVFARPVADAAAKFDLRSVGIAQVVQLIYSEVLPGSYVIDPEVLGDTRSVSFRYQGGMGSADVRSFVISFFDSLGLAVVRRGTVDFISKKAAQAAVVSDDDVFVYRPKFRDGSYLVELLGPLFSGSFTSKRAVRGSVGGSNSGADKVPPAGSAAAVVDRQVDTLVFSGSAGEVSKLKKILPQVDLSVGDVLVQAVLYEVQTERNDGSAFGLALNLLGSSVKLGIGPLAAASSGDAFMSFKNRSIDAVLSVLANDSRFKAVSKPMLRVTSGGAGRFTVGQDVPVLGSVSYPGNGASSVQSVTYQSSGVIYDVRPVVHDDSIEISVLQQISNFVSTNTGVTASPTLIKRELKSDLSLSDGEIVVMGGLSDSKDTNSSNGPAFIPAFLRNQSNAKVDVEILLILQVTKL